MPIMTDCPSRPTAHFLECTPDKIVYQIFRSPFRYSQTITVLNSKPATYSEILGPEDTSTPLDLVPIITPRKLLAPCLALMP